MPTRPDLRDLVTNVKDAFADCDRDTLLDILTFVIKEYVVEGPPPMLVNQVEQVPDLTGSTFAQLIGALQTRFDVPELQLFAVDGDQVSVRINGVMHPIGGSRAPAPAPAPAPAAAPPPRNLTLRGRPAEPPPAPPPPAAPPSPTADKAADKPDSGDDASARFSLLELD